MDMKQNGANGSENGVLAHRTIDPETPEVRKKLELTALLMERKIPDKDDILRIKSLIRDLAGDPDGAGTRRDDVEEFMSAYLDLYLGRITGEAAIEQAGLRRCLMCLTRPDAEDA